MEMMDFRKPQKKVVYAIVGRGWRAKYYLRIAKLAPDLFEVCGLVTRNEEIGIEIETIWKVKTYRHIDSLLKEQNPQFVVCSVDKNISSRLIKELAAKNIPILAETPPATNSEELIELNELNLRIQIAEQYHLQPVMASRLAITQSHLLGEINEAQISICNDYHGISLLRKTLDVAYEPVTIHAFEYSSLVMEGPGRTGLPDHEQMMDETQVIAYLQFGKKLGIYDYAKNQHRSYVRSSRFLARGNKGEIKDDQVKYLKDFKTPIEFHLQRMNAGWDVNLEGHYLKGILGLDKWVYQNPLIPYRFADDEIAVATCLLKMSEYVLENKSFYSLSEASQDMYLSLLIQEAVKTKGVVISKVMPWAKEHYKV